MTQNAVDDSEDLFGFGEDELIGTVEEAPVLRAKQPYKGATVRPPTLAEAAANSAVEGALFEDMWDKRPLSEMYPSHAEVRKIEGTNGLRVIGSFDGCGGSFTGFAWAGFQALASIEFVKAARETLSSNYACFLIEPEMVLQYGEKVAAEMDLPMVRDRDDENTAGIVTYPARKTKGVAIPESLNWEETLIRLGSAGPEFRKNVNRKLFKSVEPFAGKVALWGDDIRGLDGRELLDYLGLQRGELDAFEASPPCFPAGVQVVCRDRIRPIEEVEVGHEVLTHQGRWRRVTNVMSRQADTVLLDGGRIETTPNHPFWARRPSGVSPDVDNLGEPEWINAENMEHQFYAIPWKVEETVVPDIPTLCAGKPDSAAFWKFVGLWIGDGWLRFKDSRKRAHDVPHGTKLQGEQECMNCGTPTPSYDRDGWEDYHTIFCSDDCRSEYGVSERGFSKPRAEVFVCSSLKDDEVAQTTDILEALGGAWSWWEQGATMRYRLGDVTLARWLNDNIGRGAQSKTLPGWVLSLPEKDRQALFDGYIQADGLKARRDEGRGVFRSISHSLEVGMRVLASTLGYNVSPVNSEGGRYPLWDGPRPGAPIEGRDVLYRQAFITSYTTQTDDQPRRYSAWDHGMQWKKMRKDTLPGRSDVTVYDITVDEDHSFVADGYVVHNCKSFSTSGLRERGWGQVLHYSDERNQRTDDLFMEALRLLDDLLPRAFVMENVEGIGMGEAETSVMVPVLEAFRDLGYNVMAQVVSSKDFGVPQDRPRMLFVGIRNDQVIEATGQQALPVWPSEWPVSYTVADALEAADQYNEAYNIGYSWLGSKNDLRAALAKRNLGAIPPAIEALWPKEIVAYKLDRSLTGTEKGNVKVPFPDGFPRYETGLMWEQLPEGASPENKAWQLIRCHSQRPAPTITATGAGNQPAAGAAHPWENRKFTIPEYRFLFGFPHDYVFTGTIDQQGERMGRCVPPFLMKQVAESVASVLLKSVSNGNVITWDSEHGL